MNTHDDDPNLARNTGLLIILILVMAVGRYLIMRG